MNEQDTPKDRNADIVPTAIYRLVVVFLLAGILLVQWQILANTKSAPGTGMSTGRISVVQLQGVHARGGAVPVRVRGTVSLDSASVAQIRGDR